MATVRASRSKPLYAVVPLTKAEVLTGPLAPRIAAREGGLPADSTALCMHVRSVDPTRCAGYVGALDDGEYRQVRQGLELMLGVNDGR